MNARRTLNSLLASLICALCLALGPIAAAQADTKQDARDLFASTDELAGFVDEVGRLNPIAGGLSGEVNVFGVKASAYLYFPTPTSKPVIALLLPSIALHNIVPPLGGTPMDVTLDDPVVFITGSEGYLDVGSMPNEVAQRTRSLGFASTFKAENGFNIFGKVGGHEDDALHQVLRLTNLQSGLVAGFSSPSKKVKVNPDDAKKTKFKYRVLSLALPSGTAWENAFFMKDVSVQGAVIRMKTPKDITVDATTSFQLIGGASIGSTVGYHLFIERTFDKKDPAKSSSTLLAVNPNHAITMGDFLAMSRTMAKALGLPEALPDAQDLPLDHIRLENPFGASLAFPEEGAPPDFNKVMFAGASPMAKIPDRLLPGPLLTANAKAKVFGFEASELKLNFDLGGINATAGVKLPKLGPVDLARASLDLAIRPGTVHMLLRANSELGALTVSASSNGLSFAIPPKCPLEPLGLKASLSGFDLTKDFSVTPDMKDCISAELKELIDDVGGKATQTVGELADDTSKTADELAKTAKDEFDKLNVNRISTWAKAIDAKASPANAKAEAQKAYDILAGTVKTLNEGIDSLSHWIDNALRAVWSAIKGDVKKKKKERSQKTADRDRALTEMAAANQRKQQAEEAERRAASLPVPSQDPVLRTLQQQQLGQMAIAAQQGRISAAARQLTGDMATVEARRKLLDQAATPYVAAAETEWARQNGSSLATYLQHKPKFKILPVKPQPFGPASDRNAIRLPSGEAVFTDIIDKNLKSITARILSEEVPNLPTMAYGKRVMVQGIFDGKPLCMTMGKGFLAVAQPFLVACDSRPEQRFVFEPSGLVHMPDVSLPTLDRNWKVQEVLAPCLRFVPGTGGMMPLPGMLIADSCEVATSQPNSPSNLNPSFMFFFDPLDGLIRQAEKDSCLRRMDTVRSQGGQLVPVAAPYGTCSALNHATPGKLEPMTWRLIEIAVSGNQARSVMPRSGLRALGTGTAAGNTASPIIPEGLTNLAPLTLD